MRLEGERLAGERDEKVALLVKGSVWLSARGALRMPLVGRNADCFRRIWSIPSLQIRACFFHSPIILVFVSSLFKVETTPVGLPFHLYIIHTFQSNLQ